MIFPLLNICWLFKGKGIPVLMVNGQQGQSDIYTLNNQAIQVPVGEFISLQGLLGAYLMS